MHKRAVARRRNERRAREFSSADIIEATCPLSHKGWSAEFCCLSIVTPRQPELRDENYAHHKGLSCDFRCCVKSYTKLPTLRDKLLASGRFPTRFAAGRRRARCKLVKSKGTRTKSYPKLGNKSMKSLRCGLLCTHARVILYVELHSSSV